MMLAPLETNVFKKAAPLATALLLALSLTACSSGQEDCIPASSGGSGTVSDHSSGEASPASSQDGSTIGSNLWLKETTDFSEGRAWVQFQESHRHPGRGRRGNGKRHGQAPLRNGARRLPGN